MSTVDPIADAKNEIKDRLTSSIPSSILLAFVVWNWPAVVALFAGDLSAADRIDHVRAVWAQQSVWHQWLLPLATAGAYVIAVPVIKYAYEAYWILAWAERQANRRTLSQRRRQDFDKVQVALDNLAMHLRNDVVKMRQQMAGLIEACEKALQQPTSGDRHAEFQAQKKAARILTKEVEKNLTLVDGLGLSTTIQPLTDAVARLAPLRKLFLRSP